PSSSSEPARYRPPLGTHCQSPTGQICNTVSMARPYTTVGTSRSVAAGQGTDQHRPSFCFRIADMTSDLADSPTVPGPIESYALLSDTRTAALVDDTGSVDWLCLPRFDSPSVFARLLGTEDHGRWQITPTATDYRVERSYRANTMVLDTVFHTTNGSVRLTDSMLPHPAD